MCKNEQKCIDEWRRESALAAAKNRGKYRCMSCGKMHNNTYLMKGCDIVGCSSMYAPSPVCEECEIKESHKLLNDKIEKIEKYKKQLLEISYDLIKLLNE